nr:putative retrotransposon protein [Tanacetum cinerariifolium]
LIGLCQSAYIEKILKQCSMENSKRGSILMQEKLKLSKSQGAATPAEMKRMQNVPYASAVGSIMILIAIAAYYDYEIWQMDVKTTFLNGHLFEEVYMEQPKGFVNLKYPNHVCKLKRSIYGLKQASRQWNKRLDDEIKKFSFTQNPDEPCVYLKASGSYITILILYVNDILLMGNNIPMLQDVKSYLGRSFAIKDLGEAAYILRIKIYRDSELDETLSQNEILNDRLLKATLDEDVRNLVITSCVEIKNKNLREEIASFLKESNDVSNVDTFYNNASDVKEELSKKIVQFEKDFSKLEAQKSFKKSQFDSFSTIVDCIISDLETKSGEKKNLFERETCVLQIKIDELEQTLAKQTNENSELLMKIDNLEKAFAIELKRATTGKLTIFIEENCDFESKIIHLENIISQKKKYFDDVKLELSISTAKFEAYFKKLENTKVVLERQLARKINYSKAKKDKLLKEINLLRTQLENIKGESVETKFDKPLILKEINLLINS